MRRQPGRARTRIALAALAAAGLLAAGCGASSDGAAGDADNAGNPKPLPAQSADGNDSARNGDGAEQDAPAKDGAEPEKTAGEAADGKTDEDAAVEPPKAEPKTEPKAAAGDSAAAPWCRTGDLAASVRPLNSAAGNRYAALVLTNDSDATCRTRGWTGLQLVRADGTKVPTTVVRDSSRTPSMQTLAPGASAWSRLHWTVVASGSDNTTGACRPKPAELQVIPPDTYHHTDTAWPLGEVCDAGRIESLPLAKGAGPAR
ncbi:DUF4232 domain-containing protein [Streptomyces sp. NBC_01808]|uniref:DUF4232 domain-containing protein n=1 Tax=Streptomyces sp. NBC_01808 TaxID=2975947 RepID=UPI002DDC07F9|nr:DUF4232 domain-containing protein [Streptomyces sp. NBC_01808]WSA36354.1 DUF4232 domain-containing protein [Streptomyces sp. NBC_01808]